jgi:hypothetical protein
VHLDASKATAAELPQLGAIVTTTVSIAKAVAPPATPAPPSPQASVPPPAGPATEPAPTTPPEDPGTPPVEAPPGSVAQAPPPPPCAPPPVPLTSPKPSPVTLWQQSLRVDGQVTAGLDVEGIVQAACLQPAGLVLSADDLRESGKDLTLAVAPGIDLSRLLPGQAINATVTIGADGAYTLTGLSSDWGRKAADDGSQALGDQIPRRLRAARSSVTWRGWTRRPFVIAPRP